MTAETIQFAHRLAQKLKDKAEAVHRSGDSCEERELKALRHARADTLLEVAEAVEAAAEYVE